MVHLLNGDALYEKIHFAGAIYVFREALCEGPVLPVMSEDFWSRRQSFVMTGYSANAQEYKENSVRKFESFLSDARKKQSVYLWFEWDLFCQVNLWFIIAQLRRIGYSGELHWVQPPEATGWRGFGPVEIITYQDSITWAQVLDPESVNYFQKLWYAYVSTDAADWDLFSQDPPEPFSKLKPVLNAERDRKTGCMELHQLIDGLLNKHGKDGFIPAFRAFCKDHGYYGFGDLQFKRLWDGRLAIN